MNSKTMVCGLLVGFGAAYGVGCERNTNERADASAGSAQLQSDAQAPDAATPDGEEPDPNLAPGEATADELAGRPMPVPEGQSAEAASSNQPPLPDNWTGVGVLAKPQGKLPRRAPKWARVAAEVVERDNQRYLVTTALTAKIKNPALARSAAENRARAELARWMGNERVQGGRIVDYWHDRRSRTGIARAEVAIGGDMLAAAASPADPTATAPSPQSTP